MCRQDLVDIYCHTEGCISILTCNAVLKDVRCVIAKANGGEFGYCGRKRTRKCGAMRSDKDICRHCHAAAVRDQNMIYQNLARHVAESRATQQRRDADRRAREQGLRYAGDRNAIPTEEQASLVSGAGTEWHGGEGVYAQNPSEMFAYLDDIPQEIELDAEETAGEGSNDPGEGSSRGYDERYTHGGGRGQNQRSRRY